MLEEWQYSALQDIGVSTIASQSATILTEVATSPSKRKRSDNVIFTSLSLRTEEGRVITLTGILEEQGSPIHKLFAVSFK
jgi:hypothetical protein